jgi:5-methylcytosine-specific restriction endonuclease McrA
VGNRTVFKFILLLTDEDIEELKESVEIKEHDRLIPSRVKAEVWKRDKGQCVQCGSKDHLHFDHILPFSKGGTSIDVKNIQILCARHNLQKSDKII